MSRALIVFNLVLALVVGLLAWRLHTVSDPAVDAPHHAPRAAGQDAASAEDLRAISAQLAQIDRRLSQLDAAAPSDAVAPSAQLNSSLSAVEADRRLAVMLQGPVVDHEAMARYRAQLAMLPPAQQAALEAALSRAINQDRLRLRL